MTKRETRLLAFAGALAGSVVVVGTAIKAAGGSLGTATPPFVMVWHPQLRLGPGVIAVAILIAFAGLAPRLLTLARRPAAFAAATFAVALALGMAVNASRIGTAAWAHVFDLSGHGSFEAANEVLAGLPALSYGVHFFLDRYAEIVPSQPVGLAGHPPGLPVLLHLGGIDSAGELAAVCIAALAGVAPATFALGRSLGCDQRAAGRAALLACGAPALMLFGVTSTDAVFALAGTVAAALLCSRRQSMRVLGMLALALAALLSWTLLAVGAWAVMVTWAHRGPRAAVSLAAGCAVAVLGSQGALAAGYGYDPIGTLAATGAVYRSGVAHARPYAFWVLGSPVAFAVTAGLPLAAGWLIAVARRVPVAVALAAVVVVSTALGFTKAEVERIWLPFVPLLCIAAATVIDDRRLRPVLALLAAQVAATQLLFATLW